MPRLGAVGGAVAVTLTILIQLVVMQYAVSKTMELPVYRLEFVSPFISAVVVGWLVRCLIAATDVSPLAAIAIAGCASIILPLIYFSQIKIDDSFPELQRFRNKWISRFRPHSLEARRRA